MARETAAMPPAESWWKSQYKTIQKNPCDYKGHTHTFVQQKTFFRPVGAPKALATTAVTFTHETVCGSAKSDFAAVVEPAPLFMQPESRRSV